MTKSICRLMVLAVTLLAVCGKGFADVAIDAANFPDENFRDYVSSNFDTDSNGSLSDSEINNVTSINVNNKSITNLRGLEYFPALTELDCGNNQLTELNVRACRSLTHLTCSNNQLTLLDFNGVNGLTFLSCEHNGLGILDVSTSRALTYLDCSYNKLKNLYVDKHYMLKVLNCDNNELTILRTAGNLTNLTCHNNKLTSLSLSSLNLNYCSLLEQLYCDFKIQSADNAYDFKFTDFQTTYKVVGNYDASVAFSAIATDGTTISTSEASSEAERATWDETSGVAHFPNPEAKILEYITFTVANNSSSRPSVNTRLYSPSASSSGYDDSDTALTAPIITTSSLPSASLDVPYSATLSAIGSSPITWTLSSGSLPDGLSLDSSGTISGTPTTPGAFPFTVTASNSAGSTSRLFTIIIPFTAHRSPKITTDFLNSAYTNSPYGFKLTASGTTPLTWSLDQDSSLPTGLTLTTSGYIYGTPTSANTTAFTVYVTNSAGTTSKDLSITVHEAPTKTRPAILPENPYPATQGEEYICQLVALGTPPFTWTAKKKLPKGLSMTDSGLITGTPSKAKAAKILFTVSNDYGKETRTLTLNVCTLPEITTKALKDATVAKKYKETIKSKGSKPLTWELEGYLPQGIAMFEADNAKLIGTPHTNDSGMVRVTLSNPVGEVSKVFTLNVNATLPKISPKSLKAGKFGKQYSKAIKLKGTEPITLLLSGDLPEGLAFDSSTGKITGTPSEVCTDRKITAIAYNIAGVASVDYSLTIKAIAPKITTKKLPDAAQGNAYSFDLEATGTPTITWSATGLPSGLSMNTNGTISGTPTQSGKFSVKVSAANSAKTAKKSYKLTVSAATTQQASESKAGYMLQNVSRHSAAIDDVDVNDVVVNDVDVVNDYAFTGEYTIVAELGTVSVDESGMYDFTVTLSDDSHAGKELLYLAGSNEPSEDDTIAEFYDDTGVDISTVPENRTITVSAWLRKNRIYTPSLAVKH